MAAAPMDRERSCIIAFIVYSFYSRKVDFYQNFHLHFYVNHLLVLIVIISRVECSELIFVAGQGCKSPMK
jgi:hypothetical protein